MRSAVSASMHAYVCAFPHNLYCVRSQCWGAHAQRSQCMHVCECVRVCVCLCVCALCVLLCVCVCLCVCLCVNSIQSCSGETDAINWLWLAAWS